MGLRARSPGEPMKRRDVLLDFTPLLDVTLILLFFFLLFSTFEVEEAKSKLDTQLQAAQEQQAAAQAQLDLANAKYEQANALTQQLEKDLAIVENASGRQASNVEALMEFNRGTNMKLILTVRENGPILRVFRGDTQIATLSPDGDLAGVICASLKEAGYTAEDTVLCEFILDGSEPGTAAAYRKIKQQLMYVKGEFNYFYYSETDISMGDS